MSEREREMSNSSLLASVLHVTLQINELPSTMRKDTTDVMKTGRWEAGNHVRIVVTD